MMMQDVMGLAGKFCVVTGSTGGIGRAIATQLALFGALVTINGRTEASVAATIKEVLEANQGKIKPEQLVAAPGDIVAAGNAAKFLNSVRAAAASHGGVFCLVNNLGIFASENWVDVSDEKELEYFNSNVLAGSRLSKALLPEFLERNRGNIIFIASEAAFKPLPNLLAYSVSKLSSVGLARGIAELCKGTRVRCNSVAVGPTLTPGVLDYMRSWAAEHNAINNNSNDQDHDNNNNGTKKVDMSLEDAMKAYFKEHEPTSLIQRFLDPTEVANAVAFLASDMASGVTGSCMRVEGGIIRSI